MGTVREFVSAGGEKGTGDSSGAGGGGAIRKPRGKSRNNVKGRYFECAGSPGAALDREREAAVDLVREELEWAGATFIAMRLPKVGPKEPQALWPSYAPDVDVAYGYNTTRTHAALPSAAEISLMDKILAWVELVPKDKLVVKRVVGMRAMVRPENGRHLYSWRAIGKIVGASGTAAMNWHRVGLGIIVAAVGGLAAEYGQAIDNFRR